MKKFVIFNFVTILSLILFSCTGKENEAHAADCENSNCGSAMELSENCAGCPSAQSAEVVVNQDTKPAEKPLITFIELGSVNCIPCKKMQPVMAAIEAKYGAQIKIIFYDVWKADQRQYAQEYGIRLIPTQVFLDEDGKEIFRHEGFFSESEIDNFLQKKGLTPKSES